MRKIVATISLTLDGVMQAPGRPDEDRRGGFEDGGWARPYNDPVMMQHMGKGMAQGADLHMGHTPLRLVDSVTTTTGVVIATYHPDGDRSAETEAR